MYFMNIYANLPTGHFSLPYPSLERAAKGAHSTLKRIGILEVHENGRVRILPVETKAVADVVL